MTTPIGGTNVPNEYVQDVDNAAAALGISPSIVAAQINDESGFQPDVVSSAGAEGIAQFIPSTFAEYGTGSPDNVTDAFAAYTAYMGALLKQFDGNVLEALNQYNGAQTIGGAPNPYGPTILSNAGATASTTSTGVSGASTTGTGTTVGTTSTTAPAASSGAAGTGNPLIDGLNEIQSVTSFFPFLSDLVGVVKDIASADGYVAHIGAQVIDYPISMFKPGQTWRLVFSLLAVASLGGAWWTLGAPGGGGRVQGKTQPSLPLAMVMFGAMGFAGYIAWRPWPTVTGTNGPAAIKPGAYVYEIIEGQTPAAGPPAVTTTEVQYTEYALDGLLALWEVKTVANVIKSIMDAIHDTGLGSGFFTGGSGDESAEDEGGTEETPAEEPPAGEGEGILGDLEGLGEDIGEGALEAGG